MALHNSSQMSKGHRAYDFRDVGTAEHPMNDRFYWPGHGTTVYPYRGTPSTRAFVGSFEARSATLGSVEAAINEYLSNKYEFSGRLLRETGRQRAKRSTKARTTSRAARRAGIR